MEQIKSVIPGSFEGLKSRTVFLYLFIISTIIRFPFFFRDYIDRDESTFILMGQAWVDGHLPYTMLWDVKPPLTFFFYGLIIFLFGKSIVMIRVFGALLVALTAFFTYRITLKLSNPRAALLSGILCVFLQSMFGSIQGVMSEHLLMAFYMGALYLLISRQNKSSLIGAGILLGIALMVKISIAFPILLVGLYLLYYFFRTKGFKTMLVKILLLALPALGVILLTVLPYYLTDQTKLWWDSVILAPLAYTDIKKTGLLPLLGFCAPIFFFILWGWRSKRIQINSLEFAVLVLSVAGLLFSFIKGGRMNSHYLIQLYPPLLVIVFCTFSAEIARTGRKALPWIIGLLVLLPVETYNEYWQVARHKIQRGTFFNGEGFYVPDYIRDKGLEKEDILFLGYHIGYWNLGVYPPTMTATHPSNICKAQMFPYYNPERKTALEELSYIMEDIKPPVVITRTRPIVFDKGLVEENDYMNSVLESDYILLETVEKARIYRRSDLH